MWEMAKRTQAFRDAIAGATTYRREIIRLFGIPESEIANTLRDAEAEGVPLAPLEITTCLRRGEIEIATRYEPTDQVAYDALLEFVARRHADTLFSRDGSTVDEQVVALLGTRTVAVAESCTGGLMAARLTELPGSSAYFAGGMVAYSNRAKIELVGVDAATIEQFGAVSTEVAEQLANGAAERVGAEVGIGITGIAGPDGGTEEKPVGLVCFSVCARAAGSGSGSGSGSGPGSGPGSGSDSGPGEAPGSAGVITRSVRLPGGRSDVRERSTTVTMHLLRRLLRGEMVLGPLPGQLVTGDD